MVNRSVTAFLLFFCLLSSCVNCPDPGEIDRVADLVVKMVCDSEDTLIKSVITCVKTPKGRSRGHYRGRSKSLSRERSKPSAKRRSKSLGSVSKRSPRKEKKPVTSQTLSIVKRVEDQPYDIRYGENGLILFAEVNPSGAPMHEGKKQVRIIEANKPLTPIKNTIEVAIKYQIGNYTEEERELKTETEMRNAKILAKLGFGLAVILAIRTDSLKPLLPRSFLMVKRVKGVTVGELFNHILRNAYTDSLSMTPDPLLHDALIRSFIAGLQILELQRVVLEQVKELISKTPYRHCDLNRRNIMIEQAETFTQDFPLALKTAEDVERVIRWKSKNIIVSSSDGKSDFPITLTTGAVKFIDPLFLEQVPHDSFQPCVHEDVGQRSDVLTVGLWTPQSHEITALPHIEVLRFINSLFQRKPEMISAGDEKRLVDTLIGKVKRMKETEIQTFLEHPPLS